MSTLLLRLAAPLQSWGAESKFERRATGREPTKSGVIGLVAAALGRRRDESIEDLATLKFGVRIDKPGQIMVDFHTARSSKQTYVTRRYYLEDASFLVGLEGERDLLYRLEHAINTPFFPLFLGRRSCPPTGRICIGVRDLPLVDALQNEISTVTGEDTIPESLPLLLDSDETGAYRQRDLPVSFNPMHRKFSYRYIDTHLIKREDKKIIHDAFEEVQD